VNKKKIVLASILKPVNDARMYEKFGISLSRHPDHEIHIAGFSSKSSVEFIPSNLILHPLFFFPRISLGRILAPLRFLKFILKVKPDVIIVTTFEILIVTCIYRILFGTKIYYDIQENYYRNISKTNTYPSIIRNILAFYTRTIEYLSRPFVSGYILAERNYEKEFSFSKGKSIIIENKARKPSGPTIRKNILAKADGTINLLYSGTISEGNGVIEAIELAEKLFKIDKRIRLTIIGYSSLFQTFIKINSLIRNKEYIKLIGGDELVPHSRILEEIQKADVGLVCYRPNKSTENCIPTKLFEYQAYLLPMIVQYNPVWENACKHYAGALFIDYLQFDPNQLLLQMNQTQFYPTGVDEKLYWESEEGKLFELIAES
jgi:glycosyltransferase involved in cell wall biosynthesis